MITSPEVFIKIQPKGHHQINNNRRTECNEGKVNEIESYS